MGERPSKPKLNPNETIRRALAATVVDNTIDASVSSFHETQDRNGNHRVVEFIGTSPKIEEGLLPYDDGDSAA